MLWRKTSCGFSYNLSFGFARNTSTVEYGLYSPVEGFSSSAIGSVRYGQLNRSFVYSYTPQGNISAVCDGDRQSTYQYDEINQLIRENNAYLNKTVTYSYDAGGNILSKTAYPYTTGSLEGQTGETVTYSYGDSEWKDLLTAYNGQEITYDAIGNPLNYKNGFTFTWQSGRRLATAAANGKALSFAYNESGLRTQKTVDGVTTEYYLDGSTVLAQKTGNNTVWYYYDCNGTREALEYGGQVYYYLYNAQGDVMALYDNDLNIVTEYTYDSWGKLLSVTGSLASTVGQANPFRYRGYYYDSETELYYLNSRYYDPETGRFINADGYVSTGQGVLGNNMFTYCGNNPANYFDESGQDPIPTWARNIVYGVPTAADYVKALSADASAWAGSARFIVEKAKAEAEKNRVFVVGRGKKNQNFTSRKDKRHGSENRQKSGNRERNIGHQNGEEHSRVPKGNYGSTKRMAFTNDIVPLSFQNTVEIALIALAIGFVVANDVTVGGIADDVILGQMVRVLWDLTEKTVNG